MTKRCLPPLKALLALESVVRTGSVSAAAGDLAVTHGAVSKQIAHLEEWLGRPLFAEKRRGMVPNSAGERLAEAMAQACALLNAAVNDIADQDEAGRAEPIVLNVVAPATFAMRWLIPRLPAFHAARPTIKVRVRPTHTPEDWDALEFDVMIRRGKPLADRFAPQLLLVESLGLVMSPELAKVRHPLELPLAEAETRPGELAAWIRMATGASTIPPAMVFPHFYVALEAALSGAGALVAPVVLVEKLLERGTLLEPWPDRRIPGVAYSIGVNPAAASVGAAQIFAEWLLVSGRAGTVDKLDRRSASDTAFPPRTGTATARP
jgi:LysR family glycine cleavage system transcriptional activator